MFIFQNPWFGSAKLPGIVKVDALLTTVVRGFSRVHAVKVDALLTTVVRTFTPTPAVKVDAVLTTVVRTRDVSQRIYIIAPNKIKCMSGLTWSAIGTSEQVYVSGSTSSGNNQAWLVSARDATTMTLTVSVSSMSNDNSEYNSNLAVIAGWHS